MGQWGSEAVATGPHGTPPDRLGCRILPLEGLQFEILNEGSSFRPLAPTVLSDVMESWVRSLRRRPLTHRAEPADGQEKLGVTRCDRELRNVPLGATKNGEGAFAAAAPLCWLG
ncbi:unnamed protein product [Ostreobium quekettii]|uniref:Uncharacterized protein n=1 Tax=Ostreobium quekettii TaxID=121088 RepID=A0A8S1JEB6_9CHLO|nr:unnamed protein product [Ostreobium quekettii]